MPTPANPLVTMLVLRQKLRETYLFLGLGHVGVQTFPAFQFRHLPYLVTTESKEGLHQTVARVFGIPLAVIFAESLEKLSLLIFMTRTCLVGDVFEGDNDFANFE